MQHFSRHSISLNAQKYAPAYARLRRISGICSGASGRSVAPRILGWKAAMTADSGAQAFSAGVLRLACEWANQGSTCKTVSSDFLRLNAQAQC